MVFGIQLSQWAHFEHGDTCDRSGAGRSAAPTQRALRRSAAGHPVDWSCRRVASGAGGALAH